MHPPLYDIRSEEMLNQFSRTELLLGKEAMERLENSRVAVFGVRRCWRIMSVKHWLEVESEHLT